MGRFSWPEDRSGNFFTTRAKILNEYVPNNITDYFQFLDLTVNKWMKDFMKQKFNEWFPTQFRNELESGKELQNIIIKFLLSITKPLHGGWLINYYDQLTSSHEKKLVLAGWRASGISPVVEDGLIGFLIDPFKEIEVVEIHYPGCMQWLQGGKSQFDIDLFQWFTRL